MNLFAGILAEPQRASTLPGGDRIFQRIFTRLGCQGRPPAFHVELYPYANLAHTMRLRNDVARVRLSDILRDAPLPVIEAAAAILLAQMYRRRVPSELRDVYRQYALAHSTRQHIARVRRKRARRIAHSPGGASHDLGPMFEALNQEYFGGLLPRPRIGWSKRRVDFPVRMFRSFAQSDRDEQAAGFSGSACVRRGIDPVSRDAAREASAARRRVRLAGAFA